MKVLGQSVAFAFFLAMGQAAGEYRFDVWTAADSGLPQNTVRAILQSRDGYLWVGTLDGLARFDGVRFTVFNKGNTPGLPSNRITALYEEAGGDLWVGTENGDLAVRRAGHFIPFASEHALPRERVYRITQDEAGNLLVHWEENTLLRLERGRFVPVVMPENAPAFLDGTVKSGTSRGTLWAVTPEGLHLFARGKLQTITASNGLPSLRIAMVRMDEHSTAWVSTEDAGLIRIHDGKVVKVYTQRDGLPSDRLGPSVFACEDLKGNLWLLNVGPWLGRWKDGVFTEYSPTNNFSPSSLARSAIPYDVNRVDVLLPDREGNLWIGTEGSGLIRAREQAVTMHPAGAGKRAGSIYPMCEDRAGRIWLGSWDNGLAICKGGACTNYQMGFLTALYEDRAGRMWMGRHRSLGIFQDGLFTTESVPSELTNLVVNAILEDRAGAFWFGAERALFRYERSELTSFSQRNGLAAELIAALIEDHTGAIWIGSQRGLARFADGRFTNWSESDGLPSNHVRALYEDGQGTLWIGTYDGGLGRFKDGKFTRYTVRQGMFDNGVFRIMEDARGNFWMSSNRGIHRVNKRELNEFAEGRRRTITSVSYGKRDGMLNAECNGGCWPAGVKTRDGKLWFPTQEGAAVIDPVALPMNSQPPPVVLEAVLLDREPVAAARESAAGSPISPRRAALSLAPQPPPLRIPPGKLNLEIQYTALSLINSERLQFKYRLKGWDDDWVEAGTRRAAYYSHVAPGHYTFTVLAANSDGVWNDEGASLALIVLPAWYQTWWFRTLVVAALAGVAFRFYRARILRLQREQAAQHKFSRGLIQSQEQERKRIAAELHDSLGQNLLVIKNRVVMAKNPGASADQELDEIARLATQSLEEVREISQNLRPYQLDRLGLTRALLGLVKKVDASADLHCLADITPLDRLFSSEAETNFFRIVQEALNNVLKHSSASEARVVVERDEAQVRLLIEDNGRGFNWRTNQSEASHGMGLSGIAERVRILHGHLAIESAPGQGTRLKIQVPIPGEKN